MFLTTYSRLNLNMTQNTVYIAEPIFSEQLSRFDPDCLFPLVKKIGITTGLPRKRERELLGTVSPIKLSIVKAWTNVDARKIEETLHKILDNLRLEGEYFWDGNETLVDAVSSFMETYHPGAKILPLDDDVEIKDAMDAARKIKANRIYEHVAPGLNNLNISFKISANGNNAKFTVGEYFLQIGGRQNDRYTMIISSKTKTTDDALNDFHGAQEAGRGETNRKASIPISSLVHILKSIQAYKDRLQGES